MKDAINLDAKIPEIGDTYGVAGDAVSDCLKAIDDKIGENLIEIDSINYKINNAEASIPVIESNIISINSDLDIIQNDISGINVNLESLNSAVIGISDDIDVLQNILIGGEPIPSEYDRLINGMMRGIKVDKEPDNMAYDPINKHLYVVSSNSTTGHTVLTIISSANNAIIKTIVLDTLNTGISHVCYDPINHRMYISGYIEYVVWTINCGLDPTLNSTIDLGAGCTPRGIAYDSVNFNMWICTSSGIKIINCATVALIDTLVGNNFIEIEYDSFNGRMYLVNPIDKNIVSINCNTRLILNTISSTYTVNYIAYDSTDKNMYVIGTNGTNTYMHKISCDTDTIISTITITESYIHSNDIRNMEYNHIKKMIYMCDYIYSSIIVYNCVSGLKYKMSVSSKLLNPFGIKMIDDKDCYVSNWGNDLVVMI
jgi:hypothetical protein